MNYLRQTYIIILLCLNSNLSLSQDKITAAQFFKAVLVDSDQKVIDRQGSISYPWVEEIEFRTETRDLDLGMQEYTLRVSPSTPGKRKAQKALMDAIDNVPDFEAMEKSCDLGEQAYEQWLELYILNNKILLLNEIELYQNDRQIVLDKYMSTLDFDFKEQIELEYSQSRLHVNRNRYILEAERILNNHGLDYGEMDFADFIEIEELTSFIQGSQANIKIVDIESDYKKELLLKEIALEEAEGKQYLDFAQIRYRGPHDDLLRERVSIGLGFSFPNSGNRKMKIYELEKEYSEFERQIMLEELELNHVFEIEKSKLNTLIRQYAFEKTEYSNLDLRLESIQKLVSKTQGYNPLVILESKEISIQTKIKLLELKEEILLRYLKLMKITGYLCNNRDKNLLSSN